MEDLFPVHIDSYIQITKPWGQAMLVRYRVYNMDSLFQSFDKEVSNSFEIIQVIYLSLAIYM